MEFYSTDTIAAIATPYGRSGVGIIRISGSDSLKIADSIWSKNALSYKSHTAHYAEIVEHIYAKKNQMYETDISEIKSDETNVSEVQPENLRTIDQALFIFMKGPNSYTGEDVVELQCHGGPFVLRRVLDLVIASGARHAQPGEFTKRAFLNGKMDLSQAEAVMDMIESSGEYARASAASMLKGSLGNKIRSFRETIINQTAYIETALDDPEHFDLTGYGDELKQVLSPIIDEASNMIESWDDGHILKEGIRTAILGKPNAGKSSLMNALLDKDRAIVTDIPGTTRDTIEEEINLSGITLNIIDTAGIRHTDDMVEKIGVEKAIKEGEKADLILYIADINDDDIKSEINNAFKLAQSNKLIFLLNKIDKCGNTEKAINVEENRKDRNIDGADTVEDIARSAGLCTISISAKQKQNLEELKDTIKDMFIKGEISNNNEIIITNLRHKEALEKAKNSLLKVIESIDNGMPEDFYTIDLMDSYEALGQITGDGTGEDLINEIFSKFCVGK